MVFFRAMIRRRALLDELTSALERSRVVVLCGPRQCWASTKAATAASWWSASAWAASAHATRTNPMHRGTAARGRCGV